MKSLIIVFVLINSFFYAQNSLIKNIGVELGILYPTISHKTHVTDFPQLDTVYKYKSLTIRSTARVYYNLRKSRWGLNLFLGYASFGGNSKTLSNGYKQQIIINAGELGLIPHIRIKEFLRIGIAVKGNYFFRVWGNEYGMRHQTTSDRKWITTDLTDNYTYFGSNAGINITFVHKHIIASTECWFGINNISNSKFSINFGTHRAHENNYRILIGYEF